MFFMKLIVQKSYSKVILKLLFKNIFCFKKYLIFIVGRKFLLFNFQKLVTTDISKHFLKFETLISKTEKDIYFK